MAFKLGYNIYDQFQKLCFSDIKVGFIVLDSNKVGFPPSQTKSMEWWINNTIASTYDAIFGNVWIVKNCHVLSIELQR